MAVGAWVTVLRLAVGLVVSRFALSVFGERGFPLRSGAPSTSGTGGFFSWDAVHYSAIAAGGYPRSQPSLTSFFPLYPLLGRWANDLSGVGYQGCALAVSWVSLFFATWGVVRLAGDLLPASPSGARAAWLLAFAPASVFLMAGYAESTYIALFAWTLVFLAEDRPWLAAVAALFGGLARPEGAALGLAVVLWCLLQPQVRWLRTVVLAVTAELGFLAFSAFLWHRFASPLEEFHVQKLWHRQTTWPFHPLVWSLQQILGGHLSGAGTGNVTADFLLDDASVVVAAAGLAWLVWSARRQRALWWVLAPALVTFVVVIINGVNGQSPEADARNLMCLVPLYLLAPRWRAEGIWTSVVVVGAGLAVMFQIVFNLGGWFT